MRRNDKTWQPWSPSGRCCALYTLSIMGKHARGTAQETHHDRPDVGHSHSNTIGYDNDDCRDTNPRSIPQLGLPNNNLSNHLRDSP